MCSGASPVDGRAEFSPGMKSGQEGLLPRSGPTPHCGFRGAGSMTVGTQVLPQRETSPVRPAPSERPGRCEPPPMGTVSFPPLPVLCGTPNLSTGMVSKVDGFHIPKPFPEKELEILETKAPSFLTFESVMALKISQKWAQQPSFAQTPALS